MAMAPPEAAPPEQADEPSESDTAPDEAETAPSARLEEVSSSEPAGEPAEQESTAVPSEEERPAAEAAPSVEKTTPACADEAASDKDQQNRNSPSKESSDNASKTKEAPSLKTGVELQSVRKIAANTWVPTPSTRRQYCTPMVPFLTWVVLHRPGLAMPGLLGSMAGNPVTKDTLKIRFREILNCEELVGSDPIDFTRLTADIFFDWLETQTTRRDGKPAKYSSLYQHRKAFSGLLRLYGYVMSPEFSNDLGKKYHELRLKYSNDAHNWEEKQRKQADAPQNSPLKVVTPEPTPPPIASAPSLSPSRASVRGVRPGRRPLSFSAYVTLCDALLSLSDPDALFARAYLILSWNLMSRPLDLVAILLRDLEWHDDALRIAFVHKHGRGGTTRRDPRHVYANPIYKSACPILALAMFWACNPLNEDSDDTSALFAGWTDIVEARECLDRLFKIDEAKQAIACHVKYDTPSLLGTYSVQKGAAVFTCSGSTTSPSVAQVGLRSDWVIGDPFDVKTSIDSADPGDRYVGRTVAGLPIDRAEFASLPPHFPDFSDEAVRFGVATVFPGLPARLYKVATFFLASLVCHAEYLRSTVSATHPIHHTPLFKDPALLQALTPLVRTEQLPQPSPGSVGTMIATGIPSHVAVLCEVKALEERTARVAQEAMAAIDAFKATQGDLVLELADRLAQREDPQPQVTQEDVVNVVRESFREVGLCDMVSPDMWVALAARIPAKLPSPPSSDNPTSESRTAAKNQTSTLRPPRSDAGQGRPLFSWGDSARWVPDDFTFPEEASPAHMWNLWKLGSPEAKLVPFQLLKSRDLPSERSRRQLIDLQYLMGVIERRAGELNILKPQMSADEVAIAFDACKSVIAVIDDKRPSLGSRKRRRDGETSWTTVACLLRAKQREAESPETVIDRGD